MITRDTVLHVANLARLNLSDTEVDQLTMEMDQILHYIDKLEELDTSTVDPTAHVIPMQNVFREDEVRHSSEREDILSNAPSKAKGCFKVPKVVE